MDMWNENKKNVRPDLLIRDTAFPPGGLLEEYLDFLKPTPISYIDKNGIMIIEGGSCGKKLLQLFKEYENDENVVGVILDINPNNPYTYVSDLIDYLRTYPKPIITRDKNLASFSTSKTFNNNSVKIGDTIDFPKD